MLWLIGNEIDRRDWELGGNGYGQDEMTAGLYATAFHEIRDVIKTADPTAKIAISGVIQGTPIRLQYLDMIWDSYYAQYGYPMGNDIDIWNVHGFILREVRGSWGADTPPEINDNGFLYGASFQTCINAHHDVSYLQEFIEAFRTWMAQHGGQDKPLLVTEYGILYGQSALGEEDGITSAQIEAYMLDTFDYLLTAQDGATGYPLDENRLVQGWLWYSLNDNSSWYRDSALFHTTTTPKTLTSIGDAWENYVSNPANSFASQPKRNLLVANLETSPNPAFALPGGTTTVTLHADVANSGNTWTATGDNIVVKFWDGIPNEPSSELIASQTLNDIPGCGQYAPAEAEWPNRSAGSHTWFVEVVPISGETTTSDNVASSDVSIIEAGESIYLPIILK
jgi:hypothetical protein